MLKPSGDIFSDLENGLDTGESVNWIFDYIIQKDILKDIKI